MTGLAIIRTRTSPGPGLGGRNVLDAEDVAGLAERSKTMAFMTGSRSFGRLGRRSATGDRRSQDRVHRRPSLRRIGGIGSSYQADGVRKPTGNLIGDGPTSHGVTAFEPLVTTDWLEAHLGDPDLRVVDMRGYVSTRPVGAGGRGGDLPGRARGVPRGAHPGRGLRRLDARHRRPRRPRPGAGRPARAVRRGDVGAGDRRRRPASSRSTTWGASSPPGSGGP